MWCDVIRFDSIQRQLESHASTIDSGLADLHAAPPVHYNWADWLVMCVCVQHFFGVTRCHSAQLSLRWASVFDLMSSVSVKVKGNWSQKSRIQKSFSLLSLFLWVSFFFFARATWRLYSMHASPPCTSLRAKVKDKVCCRHFLRSA